MLKSLLTTFGLGQDDLINVFTQTLKRLDRRDLSNADLRRGHTQAVEEMMQVLRDEDVMNADTHRHLKGLLEKWAGKGPKRVKR